MNSAEYWEKRYSFGGNSGAGSRGDAAKFKAEVVNEFVKDMDVNSILDMGCGDGYIADRLRVNNYVGADVSETALSLARSRCRYDQSKTFMRPKTNIDLPKVDLVLSMDVILHLIEDDVYEKYMHSLFEHAKRFVVFYSTNHTDNKESAPHVKHRRITDWVRDNAPDWELCSSIESPIDDKISAADFYFYSK